MWARLSTISNIVVVPSSPTTTTLLLLFFSSLLSHWISWTTAIGCWDESGRKYRSKSVTKAFAIDCTIYGCVSLSGRQHLKTKTKTIKIWIDMVVSPRKRLTSSSYFTLIDFKWKKKTKTFYQRLWIFHWALDTRECTLYIIAAIFIFYTVNLRAAAAASFRAWSIHQESWSEHKRRIRKNPANERLL
jgi:hypothetical protein